MGGANGERVDRIAAGFKESQPEFVVVPSYKGNYTETVTSAKGAVYPISDVMSDSDLDFDKSVYLPAVVGYYEGTEGNLLSMPFNSPTPVLWYNKDAFAAAGVEVPATWEEVESASRALVACGMDCGFSFGWQSWVMIENFGAWHDIPTGTMENGFAGTGTRFTFNNEAVVNRINAIYEMPKEGLFKYGGRRGDSLPMFTNGECGMWMNYLSSAEVQAWWHQETGYVPITTAAYGLSKEQGFSDENPGTDTAIHQLSLNAPTANSHGVRFGNFVQVRDIINEELEAVWAGTKTAQEAMDDAVERGNALLAKFEDANN